MSGAASTPESPSSPAPEPEEPTDSGPVAGAVGLDVRAHIDGRSLLILSGNTAQWFHLEAAAPGRHDGVEFATYINGDSWLPSWPDISGPENRNCRCTSSTYEGPDPLVAESEAVVTLEIVQARGEVLVLDQPTKQNGFTLVVEFDDTPGSSDWYEVRIVPGSEAAQSTGAGLTKGATISGRVTDSDTGRPIRNVRIRAEGVRDGGHNPDTETNGDGAYVLEGLAPGTYRVRAEASGRGYIEQYYDGRLSWDEASLVAVERSEAIEGVDFALDLGASISGKVVDAITGLPIVDIRVKASDDDRGYYSDTRTDSRGEYILRGIAPGAYRIEVRGQEKGYIEELYDDELVWDEADLVIVRDNSSFGGIDFGLVRGATISGIVTDADTGLPLSNVSIEAENVRDGWPGAYAETDADGSYVLRGVSPGTYRIRAESRDGLGYVKGYFDDSPSWRDADFVTVVGSEAIEGMDFGLTRGATISGRVTDADTGLPVANVGVRSDNVDRDLSDYNGHTGPDGTYELLGVAPGAYRVRIERGSQGYVPELYDDKLDWDDADLVFVQGTGSVTGIDFSLSRGTTISGRVTDGATGMPLVGIQVGAENIDLNYVKSWNRTGDDGSYELTGIAPGLYRAR